MSTDHPRSSAEGSGKLVLLANAIVFGSSMAIMMLELVAARLAARHLGSSLYTWTSVIGVVLGGMSLGNYLGGWLADFFKPRRLLAWQFVATSVLSLSMLWSHQWLDTASRPEVVPWPLWVLACVLAVFSLPACLLGTLTPVAAKMAIENSPRTGAAVGTVYAWGAVGSILGTFLTGFVLIGSIGAQGVVCAVAGGLAAAGLLLHAGESVWGFATAGLWFLLVSALSVPATGNSPWARRVGLRFHLRDDGLHETRYESNYYTIVVHDRDEDPNTKVLVLDNLVHSYVPMDNPTRLEYAYEKTYAFVTAQFAKPEEPLSALFIGGGGFVFPVYLEAVYPCRRIDVAEIDPLVKWTAQNEFTLPPDSETKITTHVMDARNLMEDRLRRNRASSEPVLYDFIYGDAFNDFSVPYHLTTREFNDKVRRLLKPGGVYLINIIDIYREGLGRFLGAYVATVLETFPNVYVYSGSPEGPSDVRDTFVIVCSKTPLGLEHAVAPSETGDLPGDLFAWSQENRYHGEMQTLLERGRGVILTDDYAPVDNLLAPVFREH